MKRIFFENSNNPDLIKIASIAVLALAAGLAAPSHSLRRWWTAASGHRNGNLLFTMPRKCSRWAHANVRDRGCGATPAAAPLVFA
jgi:hypothetical protein